MELPDRRHEGVTTVHVLSSVMRYTTFRTIMLILGTTKTETFLHSSCEGLCYQIQVTVEHNGNIGRLHVAA